MLLSYKLRLAFTALTGLTGTVHAGELLDLKSTTLVQPSTPSASTHAVGSACTIDVAKVPPHYWEVQWNVPTFAAVAPDHQLRLSFRARSPSSHPLRAVVELAGSPYTDFAVIEPGLTPAWQAFHVEVSPSALAPGALTVRFQVGQKIGNVELADVSLFDEGVDAAALAAKDAVRPDRVAARIEAIRKRDVRVTVVDATGHVVSGATVDFAQQSHAFWFGTNLLWLSPNDHSANQQDAQQRFADVFNYGTLPFYWNYYEQKPAVYDDARVGALVEWCAAHGVATKGHPLLWHMCTPGWIPNNADNIQPILEARIEGIIRRYQGRVSVWEVANEMNSAAVTADNGVSRWVRRDGAANVVATALGWARSTVGSPPNTYVYNDWDTSTVDEQMLRLLKDHGSLPDVIGLQSHMHTGEWTMEKAWDVAERFAKFNRPLHFTEITVLSGEHRSIPVDADAPAVHDWPSTPVGEAAQAGYLARYYAVLFSHPAVRAITYWDLTDHHAWLGAPAGLLRDDMSPKPAYDRLRDLIRRQWWTNASAMSNADGVATARAFCGEYLITVRTPGGRVTIVKSNVPIATAGNPKATPVDVRVRMN